MVMLAPGPARACDRADLRVVLDVGHTPEAWGATSARGRREYEFNLALGQRTAADLKAAGYARTVVLLSHGIGRDQLFARARRAAELKADVLLSIHHDSVQPKYLSTWIIDGHAEHYADQFHGYGLFVSAKGRAFDQSRLLARALADALIASGRSFTKHHAEPIAGESRPWLDESRGIYQYDDLVVLKASVSPAVLIEVGNISNRAEELELSTDVFRGSFAKAIAAALDVYATGAKCGTKPE